VDKDRTTQPIRVEIWVDVQCVWCYIGDARWARALSQFDGEVEVVHRSFELQPAAPVDFDAQEYLQAQRGMKAEEQQRTFGAITRVAAAEGLIYDPARMKPTNSHLALELLHYAESVGMRDAMSKRLYVAYFAEGRHVGRIDELVAMAGEVGLDPDRVREVLTGGEYVAAVDRDNARARMVGVRGVPFYVIDQYGFSGAQSTEAFVDVLNRVASQA
jgi:predicted DsbA family dithiol-disulfide isomerase